MSELDAERLAAALQEDDLRRGYRARSMRFYREQADFIATTYARLSQPADNEAAEPYQGHDQARAARAVVQEVIR